MKKSCWRSGQALIGLLLLSTITVQAARKAWLHIPGGTLLLGTGSDLYLTNNIGEFSITPSNPTNGGHLILPSMSTDGNLVATAYVKVPYPAYKEGIAVYFVRENLWRVYGEFYNVWAVAIAPDNKRIAVLAQEMRRSPQALSLLNLETTEITKLVTRVSGGRIRWSPDGAYLAYSTFSPLQDPHGGIAEYDVHLLDLRSMFDSRLTSGSAPSFSPSGDWIAFIKNSGECAIICPDGTGERVLVGLRRNPPWFFRRGFVGHPVWSPDSTRLLLNEDADDDSGRVLIHEFDLLTGKRKRLTGKVSLPVQSWSASR